MAQCSADATWDLLLGTRFQQKALGANGQVRSCKHMDLNNQVFFSIAVHMAPTGPDSQFKLTINLNEAILNYQVSLYKHGQPHLIVPAKYRCVSYIKIQPT